MAADVLATPGARASAAVVLTCFSQNILVSAQGGISGYDIDYDLTHWGRD